MKEQEGTHWTSRLLVWNRGALEAPEVPDGVSAMPPSFTASAALAFQLSSEKQEKIFNVAGKICIYSVSIKNI